MSFYRCKVKKLKTIGDTNRAKNIIVSTHDSLYPVRGGGALRTLKVAENLKKKGHKVVIIAPASGIRELNGIRFYWLYPPRKQRSAILSALKFNVRIFIKFLKFISKTDIFFIHNTIAAAILPFLKIFFHFKFALDITDIHAEYLPIGKRNVLEKIFTPLLIRIEYGIIGSADSLTVATYAMQDFLIEKGIDKEKIKVVYDGTEIDKIPQEKESSSIFNVIHLGMVDRQHGVEILIQAIPKVIQRFSKTRFFIVGGGRELSNIKRLSQKLDVHKNCIFTDCLPCEEAIGYLKKAHIGIIPRNDELPNRIITTIKLFEYWASATAVVSSRLKGIAEVAEDKKDILFFEPGNAEDLADKIIFLLASPDWLERLKREGLLTVKGFDWEKLIPQIADKALE